jgi:glutathione S-transferase
VRRWEALADGILDAGLLVRYESLRDERERSRAWVDKQLARMRRGMQTLSSELEGRSWCHGDRYSLADIALGSCVGWLAFRRPGEVDWQAEYPALAKHYAKLMERAAFADTVPQAPK